MTKHLGGQDHEKIEEKYRELVQNANSIILRMDVKGNITFFNEFAQNFFGYKEEDILGKNVLGTIVPLTDSSGQDLKAMISDIMKHPGKYINNENENAFRDGRRVWISWTNKPVLDKEGRLKEILCIGNDISRIKQAQTELLKAKELAEAASKAGTVICEADWKLRGMNTSAKKYFNVESAAIASVDFLSIIFKDYAASIPKNEIIDLSITRKVFDLIRPETKDTKPLYLQVSMEVLKNQLRDVTGIILVMQDVTDMRREEMMKQDFLGLISHKLRTPVAAIFGNAQMLLDKKYFGMLSDKQKTVVEAVLKESRVLIDLIDRLLKYVEMNRVSPDLKMETIELCGYLKSLTASMIEQAGDKKIEFNVDCADKSFMIHAHKPSLESIFKNLIENAFKFNDKEILKVDIGIKRAAQKVEISISDNGRGIPPEDEDRIFEVFYQIEKDFTGNTCGAGLGLPLVKRLVRACGGDINMRSEIGRGTTFVIMLPDAR